MAMCPLPVGHSHDRTGPYRPTCTPHAPAPALLAPNVRSSPVLYLLQRVVPVVTRIWAGLQFVSHAWCLPCTAMHIIYIYNNIKYIFFHTIFYLLYHHYIYAASLCRLPHSQNIYTRLLLSYPLVDLVVLLVNMFLFASQPAVAHAWRPPPARS
jgi:hypothetical protein